MRLNVARLDAVAVALLATGVVALVVSVFTAIWLVAPPAPASPAAAPTAVGTAEPERTTPSDHVATILHVDAATDSAAAARPGDHVDILGYFSRQITGSDSMTRALLTDVTVVGVARDAGRVALTLGLRQEDALLLREAQAIGVRPFVTLRSAQPPAAINVPPPAITDRDLTARLLAGTQRASDDRR
jgi:hypothetical protein